MALVKRHVFSSLTAFRPGRSEPAVFRRLWLSTPAHGFSIASPVRLRYYACGQQEIHS
jgi:hypothetical protein